MNPILRKKEKLIKNAIGTEKLTFLHFLLGVSKVRGVSLSILLMTTDPSSIAGRRSDSGDYLHVFNKWIVVANFRN